MRNYFSSEVWSNLLVPQRPSDWYRVAVWSDEFVRLLVQEQQEVTAATWSKLHPTDRSRVDHERQFLLLLTPGEYDAIFA